MKRLVTIFHMMLGMVVVAGLLLSAAPVRSAPLITQEELKGMLENPGLVLLDVRTGRDWKSSEFKIKGAVRANPSGFDTWSTRYAKDTQLVLYCA